MPTKPLIKYSREKATEIVIDRIVNSGNKVRWSNYRRVFDIFKRGSHSTIHFSKYRRVDKMGNVRYIGFPPLKDVYYMPDTTARKITAIFIYYGILEVDGDTAMLNIERLKLNLRPDQKFLLD